MVSINKEYLYLHELIMKIKPTSKAKRKRGRPEVDRKRISRRVHPDIYNDCINYITAKTNEYNKSKGEL